MTPATTLIAGIAFFAFALVSRRLSVSVLTGPMLFLALGALLAGMTSLHGHEAEALLHILAEATLVLVLFADAAMIDTAALRRSGAWAGRMLVIGLPMTVIFGTLLGLLIVPDWPFWEIALLAAILTPTDAALGQAVITNTRVPERIRRTLAVESGLNDGLALPLILFLGCVAVGGTHDFVQTSWLVFAIQQIGLGLLCGALIGAGGGYALSAVRARGLNTEAAEGIGILALAALCYFGADLLGGNGFIAAFVGGLAYRAADRNPDAYLGEFMETEGMLLILATFMMVGVVLVPEALGHAAPWMIAMALASFLIARPAAVWLALTGSDATPRARLFLGWFGPRGLATVLFALLVVGDLPTLANRDALIAAATLAVVLSAILHGLSAYPSASRYGPTLLASKRKPVP